MPCKTTNALLTAARTDPVARLIFADHLEELGHIPLADYVRRWGLHLVLPVKTGYGYGEGGDGYGYGGDGGVGYGGDGSGDGYGYGGGSGDGGSGDGYGYGYGGGSGDGSGDGYGYGGGSGDGGTGNVYGGYEHNQEIYFGRLDMRRFFAIVSAPGGYSPYVYVGHWTDDGGGFFVSTDARLVRQFGANQFLGELAVTGPASDTQLGPPPRAAVRLPRMCSVVRDGDVSKWAAVLGGEPSRD